MVEQSSEQCLYIQLVRCNSDYCMCHNTLCMKVNCAWAFMRKESPVSGVIIDHGVMGGYWLIIKIKGCSMQLKGVGSA